MVDVPWQQANVVTQNPAERAAVLNKLRIGDNIFRYVTRTSAMFVLLLLGGVILSLVLGAIPALVKEFGPAFLTTESWNPVTGREFGAVAPVFGTLITSVIAMAIAVPLGLMIAMFLTELCPMWARRPIGIAIELLAGIPSIIYGIWGLFRIRSPVSSGSHSAADYRRVREHPGALDAVCRASIWHRYAYCRL